jgi:hypothetical protein
LSRQHPAGHDGKDGSEHDFRADTALMPILCAQKAQGLRNRKIEPRSGECNEATPVSSAELHKVSDRFRIDLSGLRAEAKPTTES